MTKPHADPWQLPSAAALIDEIDVGLDFGLVVVPSDLAMPQGLVTAVTQRVRRRHWWVDRLSPMPDETPATALAAPLGAMARLEALLEPAFSDHLLIVDLGALGLAKGCAWQTFLTRFHQQRRACDGGLALLVHGTPAAWTGQSGLPALAWADRLRRLDVTIWADLHAAPDRREPLAGLATALAVELCAWRLDLAGAIAQAQTDDLLDPLAWLARRDLPLISGARRFGQSRCACPLTLLADGHTRELEARIWRAQLTAFFPWLEEWRIDFVQRHRARLRIDEHLLRLGVKDIEDIELGALAWQLDRVVGGSDALILRHMAKIRNHLAHRRPATAEDLATVLRRLAQVAPAPSCSR